MIEKVKTLILPSAELCLKTNINCCKLYIKNTNEKN